jgi:hypothetical protein
MNKRKNLESSWLEPVVANVWTAAPEFCDQNCARVKGVARFTRRSNQRCRPSYTFMSRPIQPATEATLSIGFAPWVT